MGAGKKYSFLIMRTILTVWWRFCTIDLYARVPIRHIQPSRYECIITEKYRKDCQ